MCVFIVVGVFNSSCYFTGEAFVGNHTDTLSEEHKEEEVQILPISHTLLVSR